MSLSDVELIDAIRLGDGDALNELMLRYRSPSVSWANSITRDHHLAEDIAQEALLQAAGKLDQLQDSSRFAGWLRQIVRHHALNKLKQVRRVLTTSEVADLADRTFPHGNDPQELIVGQQELEALTSNVLSHISPKYQAVMLEFIAEAETEELMDRFDLTRGNLYNIISRSRSKMGEERFRSSLEDYLAARQQCGNNRSNVLSEPTRARPYSMFGVSIYEALMMDPEPSLSVSLTETMGITGEAFRLSMTRGCHWQGISTYDWTYTAQRAVERLGRKARIFTRKRSEPITPERHIQLLRLIHDSIDHGIPVIVWNLEINEFGLVYGYDDDTGIIHYRGFRHQNKPWTYLQLGRGHEEPELFALAIGSRIAPPSSDGEIIANIVKHAKGEEPPISGFAFGLNAYRLWLESSELGELDPLGHAYQVSILCEAREHAVAFLRLLSERTKSSTRRKGLDAATAYYERALQSLRELYPAFPYGYGIGVNQEMDARISHHIYEALEAESEAIQLLQQL